MKVKDIMKTPVVSCAPESDLGSIAKAMRDRKCGFVPVVDRHGGVVGVVTDRDVCIAAAAKGRPLSRVSAQEAMTRPVFSCFADENLKVVLGTMAKHHVRRLPVLTKAGHLAGVLSMDDIVLAPAEGGGPRAEDIVGALKGIYTHLAVERVSA